MLVGYSDVIESKVLSVKYVFGESIKGRSVIADPRPGAPAMGKCAGQVVLFVFEYLFGVD